MELQPYAPQSVLLLVTTRGEASCRFAFCAQGSDSIAEVKEALQHALRALPEFPQEASITRIECEYDGEDYMLSDRIRVDQIFHTGRAKLKVQVGCCRQKNLPFSLSQSAGEQRPTDRGMSLSRTVVGSPAQSPFLKRASPRSKQDTVAEVSSDGDVQVIGSSDPVTSPLPVSYINASKDLEVDGVRSKRQSPIWKSLFPSETSVDLAENLARAHAVPTELPMFQGTDIALGKSPSLSHLSAGPSPQKGTTSDHVGNGTTSVLDVTEPPLQEHVEEAPGPIVMSVEKGIHQETEQGNQDVGCAYLQQLPPKGGNTPIKSPQKQASPQGANSPSQSPQKQGTQQGDNMPSKSPQKQGTPQEDNMPSKSPQKFTRFFCTTEHQLTGLQPTGSQDTNASCETASRPYRKPSKRKLGAEDHELNGGFGSGGTHSPSTRRRGSRGDNTFTAIQSFEQEIITGAEFGDASTLNGSDQRAQDSHVTPLEARDTFVPTEAHRQENGDGRRRKKRKSKRNKQDRVDQEPVSVQDTQDAIAPLQDPGLSGNVGGSHGKEDRLMDELPTRDKQASQRLDGEEHSVEPVIEGTETLVVHASEHPETTPTSKRRRRLTKKHNSLEDDGPDSSLVAQDGSPRIEDTIREGPKVPLSAFVEEEHLPKSGEGLKVDTQKDDAGRVSNMEQGHVPEMVQDGRLLRVGTPVRSSPRKLKQPVVEAAISNQVGAAQENLEKLSVEATDENNRPEEKPVKKKRVSGKRKKKGEQGKSRKTESLKKQMEPEVSDSHAYSPNVSLKDANGEEDLSDGAKTDHGGRSTPRTSRKHKEKSSEKKQVLDGDQPRVPCRYKLLGCQKDYLYKTSAYYLHCRSCVYRGDCPSP